MIQQIINQNIWWQDRELIRRDPKIADLEGQKFRWRPRVLDESFEKYPHFVIPA